MKPEIIIIVAVSKNNVIGIDGELPWKIPEDLRRFKLLTMGYPCIMGKNTFESLKKPLPGRENVILSSNRDYQPNGAVVKHSFNEALNYCQNHNKIFLCGGSSVYNIGLEVADTIELTRIHDLYSGDVFFPDIDRSQWKKTTFEDHGHFSFNTYNRMLF